MTTLFGSVLAAALMAQIQVGPFEGKVVDDQRRSVDGAQIAFHLPVPWGSKVEPADLRATTDRDGGFRIVLPSLRGGYAGRQLWAFCAGMALTAEPLREGSPRTIVLRKAAPKTIKIEGPDGRPMAGARISPRVISFRERGSMAAAVPESLAESLAVTTGRDGSATLDYPVPGTSWRVYVSRPPRSARKTSRSTMGPAARSRAGQSRSGSSPRATSPAG